MIRILKLQQTPKEEILSRAVPTVNVEGIVSDIIAEVRRDGDAALLRFTERFDKARLSTLAVTREEIDEAVAAVTPEFLAVLRRAADNIRKFHECQKRQSFILNDTPGVVMGQKVIPVDRAGLYVPGGTAAYPSTVLMDAIPARVAGVGELVMVTPPNAEGR